MSFIVYPAIDLRGGKCVRLYQGDYNQEISYGDPLSVAKKWQEQGAKWLHIVDLDGAKEGKPVQVELIKEIIANVNIPVQVGGGIRELETIEDYLKIGVSRVILGTIALENLELLEKAVKIGGERIAVSIDASNGYVATNGWLKVSSILAVELGKILVEKGVARFIFTDIAKDGTLKGPNVEATRNFAAQTGALVIASGGISSNADIQELKELENIGIEGAIVGKALYSGNVSLQDIEGS